MTDRFSLGQLLVLTFRTPKFKFVTGGRPVVKLRHATLSLECAKGVRWNAHHPNQLVLHGASSASRRRISPLCFMMTTLSSSKHSRMPRPVGAGQGRFSG